MYMQCYNIIMTPAGKSSLVSRLLDLVGVLSSFSGNTVASLLAGSTLTLSGVVQFGLKYIFEARAHLQICQICVFYQLLTMHGKTWQCFGDQSHIIDNAHVCKYIRKLGRRGTDASFIPTCQQLQCIINVEQWAYAFSKMKQLSTSCSQGVSIRHYLLEQAPPHIPFRQCKPCHSGLNYPPRNVFSHAFLLCHMLQRLQF